MGVLAYGSRQITINRHYDFYQYIAVGLCSALLCCDGREPCHNRVTLNTITQGLTATTHDASKRWLTRSTIISSVFPAKIPQIGSGSTKRMKPYALSQDVTWLSSSLRTCRKSHLKMKPIMPDKGTRVILSCFSQFCIAQTAQSYLAHDTTTHKAKQQQRQ